MLIPLYQIESRKTTIDTTSDFYFIAKTDEEISLVCKTENTPQKTVAREDGWRGFRIQGILDFSLIGILAKISGNEDGRPMLMWEITNEG